MELHQFLKLPLLIEHFGAHQQEEEMDFFSFIRLHYFSENVISDHHKEHQQLPFRDADCISLSINSIFELNAVTETVIAPVEIPKQFPLYHEQNRCQSAASDIFQPPRLA